MPRIYSAAELKKVLHCDGDISAIEAAAARMGKRVVRIDRPVTPQTRKIGRNDKCFCGSGKKFKKCCLNQGASNVR